MCLLVETIHLHQFVVVVLVEEGQEIEYDVLHYFLILVLN